MSRIMIVGCGGAGKTTFSRKLQAVTNLELFHLDKYYWKPDWKETEKEEWKKVVDELSNKESWIIDGNYGSTMEIRFHKAKTIIFMDKPKWLCIYRVIKRMLLNYGRTRPDMGKDCNEKFDWEFIKYIYHYNSTRRPKILNRLNELKDKKEVLILRNKREERAYLRRIQTSCNKN